MFYDFTNFNLYSYIIKDYAMDLKAIDTLYSWGQKCQKLEI